MLLKKLLVIAHFCQLAVDDDDYFVSVLDRGEPMSDDDDGNVSSGGSVSINGLLHSPFIHLVQG